MNQKAIEIVEIVEMLANSKEILNEVSSEYYWWTAESIARKSLLSDQEA